jgi:hypothetical protein
MKKYIKEQVEEAIMKKARAKSLKEESERLDKEAKETLLPIMVSHDIDQYELEGVGKVSIRTSRGRSINETSLREQLLLREMEPGDIDEVVSSSSKKWETEYVEFKGVKG